MEDFCRQGISEFIGQAYTVGKICTKKQFLYSYGRSEMNFSRKTVNVDLVSLISTPLKLNTIMILLSTATMYYTSDMTPGLNHY